MTRDDLEERDKPIKRDCRFCVYNGYWCTNSADITVDKDGKCSGHTTKLEDSEND